MKKILLALTFLITLANAQVITPVLGGTQFTLPNSTTYFYSCNTEIYATIDAQNRARFYNKVGGQVFGAYYFYDISIDGDTLLSKTDFLQAINELPCFSAFEICGEVINAGLDSGEVIGNFLYLFQGNDTVIVDVPVLRDTSLWEIQNNILTVPSSYNGINTNGLIINDTLDLGFYKIPMYAGIYKKYANGIFFNSFGNFTTIGINGEKYVLGFAIPRREVRVEIDTNSVSMQASDIAKIRIDTSNVSIQGSQNYCDGSKYSTFISSNNSEIINLPSQYANGAIISSSNCKLDYAQLGTIIGGFEIEAKGAHVTALGAYGADGRGNLGTLNSYTGVFMGRNFPPLIDSTKSWYNEGYSLVIANGSDTLNPSTSFIVQKNGQVGISVANHNPDYSLEIGTTDAIKLPSGNTAERPTQLKKGVIRFNTDFNKIEYYDGSDIYSLHDNKPLPVYLNDAAADLDSNLESGDYYKLTGDRTVYQKP